MSEPSNPLPTAEDILFDLVERVSASPTNERPSALTERPRSGSVTLDSPETTPRDSGGPALKSLVVCAIHEDQKPLKGATGLLDWRLRGFISRFLAEGKITGQEGELVYVPVRRHDRTRHLLLVGLGPSGSDGRNAIEGIARTARTMGFSRVAISRSGFPSLGERALARAMPGIEVEFAQ